MIENDDFQNEINNVAICPPEEPPDADTDKDSDLSDEEAKGDIDHLPARILRSQAVVRFENDDDDNLSQEDDDQNLEDYLENQPSTSKGKNKLSKKRKRPAPLKWQPNIDQLVSEIPPLDLEYHPNSEDFLKATIKSPVDAFRSYFTQNMLDHIVCETNTYAAQKLAHNLKATSQEILIFVGVMLISGYHSLPYRRLYWKLDEDVHLPIVSEAIRRNRFDELMRYLHLANNEKNDGTDKLYKIRPIFDFLNSAFKQINTGATVSIDESIIPYYGRHGIKQFIKGKPIRFGYKLWVAADPSGYVHHVEPYCGNSTRLSDTGLGQGSNVVLGLVEHMQLKKGTKLYFDNLFTSVGLLNILSEKNLGGTGTLRENRCSSDMKLPNKKNWKKTTRGSTAISSTNDLLAVRWNDNNVVTILTNCDNLHPLKSSNRYSRADKKRIPVDIPGPIAKYNSYMGGVDISDQFLAAYRCRIRSKKWWWPFFSWSIDMCCVQGWLLYRRLGFDKSLLDFRRECAIHLLKSFGTGPKRPGVQASLQFSPVLQDVRLDRTDHIIEKGTSKYRRCKICGSRTSYLCIKCKVPLHPDECFKVFHQAK